MARSSNRYKDIARKVDRNKAYQIDEALVLVREAATAKFNESIDVAVNLGIDAKKSDQAVRGSVVLPAGTGKTVRVAVFAIASPDAMRIVGQLGQILGPRSLMPNPKVGTVTVDIAGAVKNAKAGQVQFRADKTGIIHCTIGRASFAADSLKQNLMALIDALNKSKPPSSKGVYLRKVSISSTMGIGVRVDQASITQQ